MSPARSGIKIGSGGDHASMGRRLLTTDQAVRASGVKAATLRAWASRGHVTNYGDGYRALWDLDELDRRVNRAQPQRVA